MVTYCAETGKSFITKVCLNGIHRLDYNIKADVKLFIIHQQRVFNIALNQVLVVERVLGQVTELFDQRDAFSSTTFRWL